MLASGAAYGGCFLGRIEVLQPLALAERIDCQGDDAGAGEVCAEGVLALLAGRLMAGRQDDCGERRFASFGDI